MTTSGARSTPVEQAIRLRIAAEGSISFAAFMELALYHSEDGYYTRPDATTGRGGDFSTSSDVSPAFGRRLAVQAAEIWERLGGGPWRIVELGPGRGLLAGDLLGALAELAPRARAQLEEMILVEISPALAGEQQRRLQAAAPGAPVRWVSSLSELPPQAIDGFLVANEFLDALPVHVVARRGSRVVERRVTVNDAGALAWTDGAPVDSRLVQHVERYGLCRRDGDVAEVCLALDSVVADIAGVLGRGAAVFVDYGHPAARLADEDHADGTLVAYHRHKVEFDLLARPGRQDITAHVNWDHLRDAAQAAGLVWAGRATQDRFLLALGLIDDLGPSADPALESPEALTRRLAARSLIMPGAGGGQRFEAAALVKGIGPDLRGLSDPFAGLT